MDIPASEHPLPTVNLDPPSTEISPPQDFNQSRKPLMPLQPTLEQLTSELTQSVKQNEAHVKLISKIHEENRELELQIKNMEDIDKTVSTSQRDRQVRHALLKAQARKLKYKQSVPSKSEAATDAALPPSLCYLLLCTSGTWYSFSLGECWSPFCHYFWVQYFVY